MLLYEEKLIKITSAMKAPPEDKLSNPCLTKIKKK